MKWDNDPLQYQKYLALDVIVKFCDFFKDYEHSKISFQELYEFIDGFFENENKNWGE